jgi:hypothetical protein
MRMMRRNKLSIKKRKPRTTEADPKTIKLSKSI